MLTSSIRLVLLFFVLAAPATGRADDRELYTLASVVPGVAVLREPGGGRSARLSAALEVGALYGLDNEIHIGGSFSFGGLKNATFGPLNATAPDGSILPGTLYEDSIQFALYASGAYRFDASARWAPVVRLDLGIASLSTPNRVVELSSPPGSQPLSGALPSVHSWAPSFRVSAASQHRLTDAFVVEAGIAFRTDIGPRGALRVEVPLTAGWIF